MTSLPIEAMTSEPNLSQRSERFTAFWRNKAGGGGGGRTQEGLWPPLTQERPSGAERRPDRVS